MRIAGQNVGHKRNTRETRRGGVCSYSTMFGGAAAEESTGRF